ncbi:MAG: hypothetical protein JWR26_3534 [Pedosphaera sp.]|nr:hypothetical protein [Pedosphaera sp.]
MANWLLFRTDLWNNLQLPVRFELLILRLFELTFRLLWD